MPTLVVNLGSSDERTCALGEGVHTIGRASDSAVSVNHKSLSRQHAELSIEGSRMELCDLGSKNGTFVDGNRIETAVVYPGSSFRCGDVHFRIAGATMPTLVVDAPHDPAHRSLEQLVGDTAEDRLNVLLKVAQLLSAPMGVDSLLSRILDLAFQLLDVQRGAMLMLDRATGTLVPRATRGEIDQSWSTSIVRWVQDNGVAGLFNDARADPRLAGAKSIVADSICSSMCAPLMTPNGLLGVLYVDNIVTPNRFSVADLEFLGAFASQAAIAVENAELVRRIEADAVLRNTLVRFFPPTTMKKLEQAPESGFATTECEVTALFADISGFTEMSSRMQPREVVELLNEYFPVMADVVFEHDGTLEKYIGDALMALWGAPFRQPDDAERALAAAVAMQKALISLNARWQEESGRRIAIHIGLNSGVVAAGNIGSESYVQYAAIGDATNVASRICSVAEPGEIVIADATRARLRSHEWPLEELPPTFVKGKNAPLRLFRVRWT